MKHLWINEKRIDGISMLSEEFKAARSDGETFKKVVESLLDAYDSGVLATWIQQQQEYHRAVTEEKKKLRNTLISIVDNYENGLRTYIESESRTLIYESLSEFSGVDSDKLKYFEEEKEKSFQSALKKVDSIKQSKIDDNEVSLADDMSVKEMEKVACTSFQLDKILTKLRIEPQADNTVLLCNTKDTGASGFTLDLRGIKNTTFIGENNPIVNYSYYAEEFVVDLKENNIRLENFTLRFTYNEHCLRNLDQCSERVKIEVL